MSHQDGAIKQPASDLSAFDLSKRSPEEIAQLFARWKERRKSLQQGQSPVRAGRPPRLRPIPAVVRGVLQENLPETRADTTTGTPPSTVPPAREGAPVQYSPSFVALLSTRVEPPIGQRVWNPDARLPKLGRPHPPRRRSRMKWVLAGAASVIALTAVAGGALWQQPELWRQAVDNQSISVTEPASIAVVVPAPVQHPLEIQAATPFAALATQPPAADWPLRHTIDAALMTAAAPAVAVAELPLIPKLKPPAPVVRTASKPSAPRKPEPIAPSAAELVPVIATSTRPLVEEDAPALPIEESAPFTARASVTIPPPQEEVENRRTRPSSTAPYGGSGSGNYGAGEGDIAATKAPNQAGPGGSTGGGSAGGGSAGGGSGGSGDPGGGTGGSGDGGSSGGAGGGDPGGGDPGGGDPGGGSGGSGGDGGTGGDGGAGGGDSGGGGGGGAGGGDSGGGDPGGGDSGGGDSGGGDSGSGGGDSGGDSGSGDDGASSGGLGGALGGGLGGLGGGLGGGDGKGKGKDKDKDKEKGKQ